MVKKLIVIVLLVSVVWAVASSSAFAEEPMLACGELSEEDCDVLMEGMMATMGSPSVASDGTISILLENVPDAPVDTITFDLSATSMFSVDPMASMKVMELEQAVQANPDEEMPAMLEASAALYESAAIASDMELVTTEDVASVIAELTQLEEVPESVAISVGVVDGLGFVNLDEVAPLIPDEAWSEALMGWHAVNLVELYGELADRVTAMKEQGMSTGDAEIAGMVTAIAMGNSEPFREFLTVERLEDGEMDGQAVAVIETSVDFAALLASPLFQELVSAQIQASNNMSDDEVAEMESTLQMVGFMAPVLVEGLEGKTVRMIGLEDGFLHAAETNFIWDLSSLSTLAELVGVADATAFIDSENPPVLSVDVVTNYSDFGEPVEAELPDEYLFYPTEGIMASLTQ